jgi:biopolymer transport protein ExbB
MSALIKFITEDWFFFLPMLLLSLVAAALVVWRWLLNLNARTNLESFLPVFQEKLQREGVESALKYSRSQGGVIPRKLYAAGLENSRLGLSAMKRAMANAIELEILPDLNFLLAPILAIAKIATMVGLFFTVISMINTFDAIGRESKEGKAKEIGGHSSKIGLALFATALGLFTAIPLVFSHVLFKDWIAKFEIKAKAASQKLITLVTNYKKDPKLLDKVMELEDDEEDDRRGGRRGARRG